MRKRNNRIWVRLNDEEFSELTQKIKQSGYPREVFIRKVLKEGIVREAPPADYTGETIPNMTDTYDTLQQQMRQNLSETGVSSEQLLDRHSDSGKKEPDRKQQKDTEKQKENSWEQQGQSLLDSQRQLEQQMRDHLKPPVHRDRSLEL